MYLRAPLPPLPVGATSTLRASFASVHPRFRRWPLLLWTHPIRPPPSRPLSLVPTVSHPNRTGYSPAPIAQSRMGTHTTRARRRCPGLILSTSPQA